MGRSPVKRSDWSSVRKSPDLLLEDHLTFCEKISWYSVRLIPDLPWADDLIFCEMIIWFFFFGKSYRSPVRRLDRSSLIGTTSVRISPHFLWENHMIFCGKISWSSVRRIKVVRSLISYEKATCSSNERSQNSCMRISPHLPLEYLPLF